jgi:hypothetical protein
MFNDDFACNPKCESHSTNWYMFIDHPIIDVIAPLLSASLNNKLKKIHVIPRISLNKIFRYEYIFDLSHSRGNHGLLNTNRS